MTAPLIVQCGAGKLPGIHAVIDLYTGPLWSTLRKVRQELGVLPVPVYVLSARYGVVPVSRRVPSYNAVLDANPTEPHHVHPDSIVPLVSQQLRDHGIGVADFCGSQLYSDTLAAAGAVVGCRVGGTPFRHGIARAAMRQHLHHAAGRA